MLIQLKRNKKNKGFSIIEILISIFIIVVVFINFLGIVTFSLKSANLIKKSNEANFLTKEAIEAVRNFRDNTDWDTDGLGSVAVDTDYFPQLSGSAPESWNMVLGTENTGNFNRKIVFEKVSRDPGTGEIEGIYNSLNNDPSTRKVISTVSFDGKSIQITTYFTNWQQ